MKRILQKIVVCSILTTASVVSVLAQAWQNLNTPDMTTGPASVLCYGNDIYCNSNFVENGEVVPFGKYDGTNWSSVGGWFFDINNIVSEVSVIKKIGDYLYVGGQFTNGAGVAGMNRIGRYNMTTQQWEAMGNGITTTANVKDIVEFQGFIVIGGDFEDANGNPNADGLLKWDGTSWSELSTTPLNRMDTYASVYVVSLIVNNNTTLYIGGRFDQHVVKYSYTNPNTFVPVGNLEGTTGISDVVTMIQDNGNGDIYVANNIADGIAKWDGSSWSSVLSGLGSGMITAMTKTDGRLYFGGVFTQVGSVPNTSYIAAYYDGAVHDVAGGLNNTVRYIAPDGYNIVVSGTFSDAGGDSKADGLARFVKDGSPLGINETANETKISVFPNPAQDNITISNLPLGASLRIVDISGKVVKTYSSVNSEENLNVSDLLNGIYILQVESEQQTMTERLVINH